MLILGGCSLVVVVQGATLDGCSLSVVVQGAT